jgi:hypothetical protein
LDVVTSYDLWEYIKNKRNDRASYGKHFYAQYNELQIRLLPANLLKITITTQFIAKILYRFGGLNSAQHKSFLASVDCTVSNIYVWFQNLMEEKTVSIAHSYTLPHLLKPYLPQNVFRTVHYTPLPVPPNIYNNKLNNGNTLNMDILNFVFVTEYSKNTKSNKYDDKSITDFIKNDILNESDVKNMRNFIKYSNLGDFFCWCKDLNVLNQYLPVTENTAIPLKGFLEPVELVPLLSPIGTNTKRENRWFTIEKKLKNNPYARLKANHFYMITTDPGYQNE